MSTVLAGRPRTSGDPTERPPRVVRFGTMVWLASELMFFAGLFAAWFSLRAAAGRWPPTGVHLESVRAGVFTAVLIVSSVTMHRAVRAAEGGRLRLALRWTAATFLLGAAFVANQLAEYAGLSFSPTDHAYGSMFVMLTGFHTAHVVGGLALMVAVLALGLGPASRAPFGTSMAVAGYYWHFVDAVWVAMFATIYLVR